jgi:hypothetical protein
MQKLCSLLTVLCSFTPPRKIDRVTSHKSSFLAGLVALAFALSLAGCDNSTTPDPAHTHQWDEWATTIAATCTAQGSETRTCTLDATHKQTQDIPIDKDAHQWGELIHDLPPTFIATGTGTGTCSLCGKTETRTVNQLVIETSPDWDTALSQLNGKTGAYTLTIGGDIGVAGRTSDNFGETADGSALNVTLKGSGKLYLTSRGSLLHIAANQTLVIDSESLTLQGLKNGQNGMAQDNNAPLVVVALGGTLELKNGTISDNTAPGTGGGVYVNSSGTFTMSGGVISGNTAFSFGDGGGGVYVASSGTFTMHNGVISGNTADSSYGRGGGVYVASSGTFTMHDGIISGNTADSSFGNGGGVYVNSSGTFTMSGGVISGNTASSSSSWGGGVCEE